MPDDVLRLRATVVSDEALANIRKIGREIGLVQSKGGAGTKAAAAGAKEAEGQFAALSKSVSSMGKELMSAVPALGGFGIGVAGAGLAARVLIGTLGDIAAKMVDMKHASKELGMTTQELQAFSTEARKAGIAPEAMMAGPEDHHHAGRGDQEGFRLQGHPRPGGCLRREGPSLLRQDRSRHWRSAPEL
jgi:hypothetical protein